MEQVRKDFIERYSEDSRIRSVVKVQKDAQFAQLTDGFDILILVIIENREPMNYTTHYIKEPYRIQERWIHKKGIESWILNGDNRNIIQWLLKGDILLDRDGYMEQLLDRLHQCPDELRDKKLFMEFCSFVRCHTQCKEYLNTGHDFDAYSSVQNALVHWARMVVIERGYHPEVTVWNQIHNIEPAVYKVYEEFIHSKESLEQRVQLALLASEFSVLSKMKVYCKVILKLLEDREEPWSAIELKKYLESSNLHVELALILNMLVKRSHIKTVSVPLEEDCSVLELRYTSNKK